MKIHVLLFAGVAEAAGARRVEIEVAPGAKVGDVPQVLGQRYPKAQSALKNVSFAVDAVYAKEDAVLHDGATVAIIPPVSGG